MNSLLANASSKTNFGAMSPMLELGAYEWLWSSNGSVAKPSFKAIAELFSRHPGAAPSELVREDDAIACAKAVLSRFEREGIKSFSVRLNGTSDYPEGLRSADNPCELLYFQGNWDLTYAPKRVAIVGTRNPSDEGLRRTQKLVNLLVDDGHTIVSGLAAGVDSMAHHTAIERGGETIAVIGTPLDHVYPKANADLQRRIAKNYLLVSQVPVLAYAQATWRWNRLFFPERNVTMSALTQATVIVEAGETSGTLIQARAALAQKRKLFILESNFQNPALTWPERLMANGAIRVRNFEDIQMALNDETQHH